MEAKAIAYKQIVHTWMYGGMPIEDVAKSLTAIGADGADLSVSYAQTHNCVDLFLKKDLNKIFSDNGLAIKTVNAMLYDHALDLSSSDKTVRKRAIEFVKRCIEVSATVDCNRMLISPSCITVTHKYNVSYEEDWKVAVGSVCELGEWAAKYGVTLMIEPINRYRVALVHTLAEAIKMARETGLPNIAAVPDTFHMNMEEMLDIPMTLINGGKFVKTLHVSDNNRLPPGFGVLDWRAILLALYHIGFDGCLSHEPVGLYFNEDLVSSHSSYRAIFERRLSESMLYLRHCMRAASQHVREL